jgi:tRNA(fMet)-specific endonuclease VapC
MNGKLLLDTNIVIPLFAQDPTVLEHLQEAEEVFIPSNVMGELYSGAGKSKQAKQNIARIDEFAINNAILGCDIETARYYGEIKTTLRKKGRPVPENDIWIAAIALQHDLTLVTRDAHFEEVDNLRTESW